MNQSIPQTWAQNQKLLVTGSIQAWTADFPLRRPEIQRMETDRFAACGGVTQAHRRGGRESAFHRGSGSPAFEDFPAVPPCPSLQRFALTNADSRP
jgi:hypothetical protein